MSTLAGPMIAPADERHLGALMAIMAASFDLEFGEAWSAQQLAGTIGLESSFAQQALDPSGVAVGFALSRAAGPEVELLLIAVHPRERGQGIGRLLMEAAGREAIRRGAVDLFLEVRENNAAARVLYRHAGFVDIGRRTDYYVGATGRRFAAITMRRHLGDLSC